MIKVGYLDESYSSDRNFLNLNPEEVSFKRIYDVTLPHRVLRKLGINYRFGYDKILNNYFKDFGLNNVDIIHLFNRMSLSNKPWITTYETQIPYWSPESSLEEKWFDEKGIKLLQRDSCKKIISISQNAYDLQLSFLEQHNAFSDDIKNKMTVLHPAQELIVNKWKDKQLSFSDPIEIILVGHQFFVKGGNELLMVIDRLLSKDYNLNLTIVSKLMPDKSNIKTTQADINYAKKIINKHPGNIKHFNSLPNNEVLSLFKKSHLAVLCSYSETYGFSLLEAQASGCPVITTNIRAFPENNNEGCGWMINVPQYESGYAKIDTPKERKQYSNLLIDGLHQTLVEIMENPEILREKGNNSIERIRKNHDPSKTANRLVQIYKQALS